MKKALVNPLLITMRVMLFIDHPNCDHNILHVNSERKWDKRISWGKLQNFVMTYLQSNMQYKNTPLQHIRTLFYTGEYKDNLIKRIKKHSEDLAKSNNPEDALEVNTLATKTEKKQDAQKKLIDRLSKYYFFEVKTRPLQYRYKKGIVQKGIDVQLAVDLISQAYQDTFDIAVLFSGDIDLLESVEQVKALGKHVIVVSHYKNMAKGLVKAADMFIDMGKLEEDHIKIFTYDSVKTAPQK